MIGWGVMPATVVTGARRIWFDGYVWTYLGRDSQSLSAISALSGFRRLMRAASLRVGQPANQTDLARNLGLPQATVHRHLNLPRGFFNPTAHGPGLENAG